jgi:uncharacterized membrane protein
MVHVPALVRLDSGTGGPFDLVNGLPVHPLVVHAAVVLVPLTALGLLVMALWPRFSRSLGWLVALGGLVAAGSAAVAKASGESLAERVGEPGFDHADLGEVMPILAAGLLVMVVILWLVDRSAPAEGRAPRRALRIAVAVLAGLVAVANLVWIYRVGDSGAKSVWSARIGSAASEGSASDSGGDQGEGAGGDADDSGGDQGEGAGGDADDSGGATYTMAQVATRDTASDCWVAIDGNVYDLTSWVAQHPGGAAAITGLCGTDGTAAFQGQHSGQSGPERSLSSFLVGALP